MIKLINFTNKETSKTSYYLCKNIDNYIFHYEKLSNCYEGLYLDFYEFMLNCFLPQKNSNIADYKRIIYSLYDIIKDDKDKIEDTVEQLLMFSQLYSIDDISNYVNDKLKTENLSIDLDILYDCDYCAYVYKNEINFISFDILCDNLQCVMVDIIKYLYKLQVSEICIFEIFYNIFIGDNHENTI